jgi:hypothetical protein
MPTSRLQPEQLSWILDARTDLLVSDMRRARSAFQKPLYRRQGNALSANRTRGGRDPKLGLWEAKDENLAESSETIIREHSVVVGRK